MWGQVGVAAVGVCSPVGSPKAALQLPGVHIPDVEGSISRTCQRIASVWTAGGTAGKDVGEETQGHTSQEALWHRRAPSDTPEHSFGPV